MGLLDDAIREHLELKRRHGADETEIRQKEQEAFGPARTPAPPADSPADPPADEPAAEEPVPAPVAEEFVPEPVADAPPPRAPESGDPPARAADPEPWLDEPDEVPAGDALDHRVHDVAQPTREFAPDEAAAARGDAPPQPEEGDDLLEETPEFLQETPEHDRLWFEQKPPRDFDF